MISIRNSEVFKKDYARYQESIKAIKDETKQKECLNLLIKLANEIATIDMHHESLITSRRLPEDIKSTREKIFNLKKILDKTLTQAEQAQARQA